MSEIMINFKLIPSISPSEKDFKDSLPRGREQYNEIIHSFYEKCSDSCNGCGYSNGDKGSLQAHLHWWDEKNHDTAEFVFLCEACHAIKHFDQAVKNGWVVLVNSVYSQSELIARNRRSRIILEDIKLHKIVVLKKSAEEYLNEILESDLNRNEKTKILFGNKFVWKTV